MWDPIKDLLMSLMESALGGFDEVVTNAADVLMLNGVAFDAIWTNVANKANTILTPFCNVIIVLCLMVEIAQVSMKVDVLKYEHGIKLGIKACLAKVFIDVSPTLLKAIYLQGQSWISSFGAIGTTLGWETLDKIEPLMDAVSGLGNILGMFLSTFIVLLAIKICGLMVMVIAYGRMFEILVYLLVSPVPCAFMPLGHGDGGGFSRTTAKFLRSFAAVCLQGVMMMMVLYLFDTIIGSALITAVNAVDVTDANAAVTNLIYTMLLGAICLVMAITRCGSWARNIMDAM